jgi:F-type H+-transporting ATPase subunit b
VTLWEFVFSAQLWAAPAAHVEEHAPSVTQLIFPLINFLIFLYLVKRFALPPVRDYFRSRREEILSAVEGAGEGKRAVEVKVRDYQGRLSRLASEATQIQQALRGEGEREKAKLLAEAEDLAAKVKADAGFLAEQEVKMARREIRAEIARLAQEAAQKALERHLTPADQRRLVEEFLGDLRGVR